MIPLRLSAIISPGGKLLFSDTDLLRSWLQRYAGKEIDVTLRSRTKDKTTPQCGYLFGHVVPQLAEYTGYSEEEMYGLLKYKFLKAVACLNSNPTSVHAEEYIRSLSTMTCEEVSKFIEDCVRFGTDIGAEIYPSQHFGGHTNET